MRFNIPDSELSWRFDTSGGPGGQHANRSSTRVELKFDIQASKAFGPSMTARLTAALGPTVRISENGRSQATNRKRAVRRLHALLEEAARPAPPNRLRTRPSLGARNRRLSAKRRRSELKKDRKMPQSDD